VLQTAKKKEKNRVQRTKGEVGGDRVRRGEGGRGFRISWGEGGAYTRKKKEFTRTQNLTNTGGKLLDEKGIFNLKKKRAVQEAAVAQNSQKIKVEQRPRGKGKRWKNPKAKGRKRPKGEWPNLKVEENQKFKGLKKKHGQQGVQEQVPEKRHRAKKPR